VRVSWWQCGTAVGDEVGVALVPLGFPMRRVTPEWTFFAFVV
jgi:hypothetical protein